METAGYIASDIPNYETRGIGTRHCNDSDSINKTKYHMILDGGRTKI